MSNHPESEIEQLFFELISLDQSERAARLIALAPQPEVLREVQLLIAADARAGDFLGVLVGRANAVTADIPPLATDTVVARRYRVERFLGRGAMGEVYLAHDLELGRSVALKFVRATADNRDAALARFATEARATARLNHAHVATVYDVGEDADGRLFIAMAYYPGQSLRVRLAEGPLPQHEALRIAAQLADALAAAHSAGIIHRDVKPSNVLFDAAGLSQLADFGVAKLVEVDTSLPGLVVGTPGYMSPEQAQADPVDGRSDLWALGATLFEMLTGRRPDKTPDFSQLPDGPVRAIVTSLLAENPAQRPASATDAQRALQQALITQDDPYDALAVASPLSALPSTVTSFIGREALLVLARSLLSQTRLLTLTGPGGTGKTRLAMQLASTVRANYADDMWFVPLADIADAALVPSSIAQVVGVRDPGASSLADRLLTSLRNRRALLVLDNFEHVLAARAFVARILSTCPQVTVLVTSREPLTLQGEQEFPIPPLTTPMPFASNVAECEAVQLFVQRARMVRPGFELDVQSTDAVAEICRRLDGLPLALELAAARTKLLSPRAMLARLEHRLDLLRVDAHDRPARHRTMREVIDWSFVLLTDDERTLFCWLSVFSGGIAIEAAEAIGATIHAASPNETARPLRVLELLTSLCNKSLLRHEELPDGDTRFFFLETVREFALERLRAANSERDARLAFRAWCLALAERAAGELRGASQATWIRRLQREYANLRHALDDALNDTSADNTAARSDAVRFTLALHRLWATRGPLDEGADYLKRVIAAVDAAYAATPANAALPGLPLNTLPALLNAAAVVASSRSLFVEMRDFLVRCLPLQRAMGDTAAVAVTLNNLGWAVWIIGDAAAGRVLSTEALAMHELRGDTLGVALSHQNLAWISSESGLYADAESHFLEAIASHRARSDERSAASCVTWLGLVVARRGEWKRALELHQQALDATQVVAYQGFQGLHRIRIATVRHAMLEPGDHLTAVLNEYVPAVRGWGGLWPIAAALSEMGVMLRDAGELARARVAFEEEIVIRRKMGARVGIALAHVWLASVVSREGEQKRAATLLLDAFSDAQETGSLPILIEAVEVASLVAMSHAHYADATRLLGAASGARDALGAPRSPRGAHDVAAMRASLEEIQGATTCLAEWTQGASVTLPKAVELARRVLESC